MTVIQESELQIQYYPLRVSGLLLLVCRSGLFRRGTALKQKVVISLLNLQSRAISRFTSHLIRFQTFQNADFWDSINSNIYLHLPYVVRRYTSYECYECYIGNEYKSAVILHNDECCNCLRQIQMFSETFSIKTRL